MKRGAVGRVLCFCEAWHRLFAGLLLFCIQDPYSLIKETEKMHRCVTTENKLQTLGKTRAHLRQRQLHCNPLSLR